MPLCIHTQAGVVVTNQQGYLSGCGWVWYLEHGIADILALKNVKKRYRVTYDSQNGNDFVVHKDDGEPRRFKESKHGLYYMDIAVQGVTLVNTNKENKSRYTKICRTAQPTIMSTKITHPRRIVTTSIKTTMTIQVRNLLPLMKTTYNILMTKHKMQFRLQMLLFLLSCLKSRQTVHVSVPVVVPKIAPDIDAVPQAEPANVAVPVVVPEIAPDIDAVPQAEPTMDAAPENETVDAVPQAEPAIDDVALENEAENEENETENEPADDAVLETDPAADAAPQDVNATEEAAVIENDKVTREMQKLSSEGGPPATFSNADAVPENMPAIDAAPENKPAYDAVLEAKPEDDAVPQAEPAAEAVPQQYDANATEEAAVIENDKVTRDIQTLSLGGGPPANLSGRTRIEREETLATVESNPKDIFRKVTRATEARSGSSKLSRQRKRHQAGEQWSRVKWKAHAAHQCAIFFYC